MISQTQKEKWHFTRIQANTIYKIAVAESKKKPLPGVPSDYMKTNVNGDWFYRVNHLQAGDQRNVARDLWAEYGFLTYYNPKHSNGFYVRRA